MERVIEVRGIKKAFGDHEVLRGVDFAANKGEVTCIIGSSGSGKSTLLRCINLLETPDEGQILYHGEDILSGAVNLPRYHAKVGMVFQQFNLFGNMDVLNNCVTENKAQFLADYEAVGDSKQAHHCVACRKCCSQCPQSIDIPTRMEDVKALYKKLKG